MADRRVWDRGNQMPLGREFEVYHCMDVVTQPVYYHSHPHYEIFFYVHGRSRIVVEGLDLLPVKGDVLIYPPGVMHRNIHLDSSIPYERFYFFVTRHFLHTVSTSDYDLPATLARMTENNHFFFHVDEEQLAALLEMADQTIEASELLSPAERMINQNRFCMMLVRALTMMAPVEAQPQSEHNRRMSELIRFINKHVSEPITLDRLAGEFFISKYVLMRDFKKFTGMSVHQYLIDRRILTAKELITRELKPRDVSLQCGFVDYSSFFRAFRARVGISPEQFRAAVLKADQTRIST